MRPAFEQETSWRFTVRTVKEAAYLYFEPLQRILMRTKSSGRQEQKREKKEQKLKRGSEEAQRGKALRRRMLERWHVLMQSRLEEPEQTPTEQTLWQRVWALEMLLLNLLTELYRHSRLERSSPYRNPMLLRSSLREMEGRIEDLTGAVAAGFAMSTSEDLRNRITTLERDLVLIKVRGRVLARDAIVRTRPNEEDWILEEMWETLEEQLQERRKLEERLRERAWNLTEIQRDRFRIQHEQRLKLQQIREQLLTGVVKVETHLQGNEFWEHLDGERTRSEPKEQPDTTRRSKKPPPRH